jgi:hypothetical protein
MESAFPPDLPPEKSSSDLSSSGDRKRLFGLVSKHRRRCAKTSVLAGQARRPSKLGFVLLAKDVPAAVVGPTRGVVPGVEGRKGSYEVVEGVRKTVEVFSVSERVSVDLGRVEEGKDEEEGWAERHRRLGTFQSSASLHLV